MFASKLKVQRERRTAARNGMFMDTRDLFLVGDWNNNSSHQ